MFSEKDFQALIPDEGIRNYIVEGLGSNPFDNTRDYYTIFHNIINLAFMYAFSCYTDLRNRNVSGENELGVLDRCRRNGNANSLRVLRTMEKIYREYPISNELIQFVLLDIQFDFQFGVDSKLMDYFPNCFAARPAQLNEYFTMINLSLVSSRLVQYDLKTLEDKLRELISIFPFLSKSSLKFFEQAGWYVFETDKNRIFTDGYIHTYGLIHRIKRGRRGGFYYLALIEKNMLRYENYADSQFCTVKSSEDVSPTGEEVSSPYELSWDEEAVYTYLVPQLFRESKLPSAEKKAKIEQLFNINYKHIKNLALAISDSIGREAYSQCGEDLIAEFGEAYPDVFQKYHKGTKNWDAIIVMLLIEASPSRVLKVIFRSNPNIGNVILRSLKHRFGWEFSEKLQEIQTIDDFNEQAESMIEISQLHLGNQPIETHIYNSFHAELLAEAKATIILSALSNMKRETTFGYTGNIGQGVESLENFSASDNPERLCQAIRETLGVVLKRIACFYAGLFAYGEKKMEYDKKSESRLLPQEEIDKFQALCKEAFETAVKAQWRVFKEMPEASILAIIKEFFAICQRCSDVPRTSHYGRSDESRYLYTVLGKYSVLDIDVFEKEIEDAELVGDLSTENASWWQEKAIRLMRFFATGDFECTGDSAQYFQRAIAPVVASYSSFKNSKDGYGTATFYLTIDVDGNNTVDYHKNVNVLSEFSYDMHTQYYCLPNVVRSNEKWWIDPFVIECAIIDKICTR